MINPSEKTNTDLDIQLRPVSQADVDAMRQLYRLSLDNNVDGFVQDIAFHGDIAERSFEYQANGGEMLGVFINGDLAGFGGIRKKPKSDDADKIVELCNLHMHPSYQGFGIGKKLALTLIDIARQRNYAKLELHVTVTQKPAIGLYQRLGFIQTHTHVYELFGKTYDTVFMEFPLTNNTR